MSKIGQPREAVWTKEEDDFLKEHCFMTVKELAKELNRTEAAVRNRKNKIGVKRGNCKPFTDQEKEMIKKWYTKENGVNLQELSKLLNRSKTSISKIARDLGCTKYGNYTEQERKERSVSMSKMVLSIEHPRGMLGKHHTDEVKKRVSIASSTRAANMTYEEKHEIAMKAVETKRKNGVYFNTTSNAYSRTKSGIRKDLGQYFRSAWEANIARILDYEDIEWEYECKRFFFKEEVDGVLSYQPDFYLPQFNKWIEVKGWMDEKSKIRLKLFAEQYPEENNNLILVDEKFYKDLYREFYVLPNWESDKKYD